MKTALGLGYFDGLHKGHLAVLDLPQDYFRVAVTFKNSPKSDFPTQDSNIIDFETKCSLIKKIGINEILSLDFEKVKDTTPKDFLDFLKEKYNPSLISCGFNYHFGKNRSGNTSFLSDFCNKHSIKLRIVKEIKNSEHTISSTYIKQLLKSGKVAQANNLLFQPFSFTAEVITGDKRGRTIGFPTINQVYPENLVCLKFGVYKTILYIDDKKYLGITNIGKRPTYPSNYIISETYIENFSQDVYGKKIKIIPIEFLREEQKFSSILELKAQISKDIKQSKEG